MAIFLSSTECISVFIFLLGYGVHQSPPNSSLDDGNHKEGLSLFSPATHAPFYLNFFSQPLYGLNCILFNKHSLAQFSMYKFIYLII